MSDSPTPMVSINVPTTISEPTPTEIENSAVVPHTDEHSEVPLQSSQQLPDAIPMNCLMQLDPNYPVVDRIGWWILIGVVGSVLLVIWLVVGFAIRGKLDAAQWSFLFGIAGLVALGIFSSRFFPRRTYETTRWQLLENGVEIRKGIWWRHRIFVPHDRIQHTDVNQGPIGRMYGLATLVINTGGTHEPSIALEGIHLDVAERLRALLSSSTTKLGPSSNDPS